LFNDEVPQVLVNIGSAAVLLLITELYSKDINMRLHAISILGEIGDKRAIEPLKEVLKSETNIKCIKALKESLLKLT